MSQHSEELAESAARPPTRPGARILPFERPQSELQRAIQERAQHALDRDRERDEEKRRPKPLKWLALFAIACIPVFLLFAAVDAFLRVFYKVTETYNSAPPPAQAAPAAVPDSSQPGVVFIESYDERAGSATGAAAPAADPQPGDAPPPR